MRTWMNVHEIIDFDKIWDLQLILLGVVNNIKHKVIVQV